LDARIVTCANIHRKLQTAPAAHGSQIVHDPDGYRIEIIEKAAL
jgi:hypothetical protein